MARFKATLYLAFITLFIINNYAEAQNKNRKVTTPQKLSFTDDLVDMILGFIFDLVDTFQGVMDMFGAVGRKKRSILSQVLTK
ncbi:hypothetical protein TcasGA2_TC006691 [Tribolium castaneum]|uniref:Uncharacterized protein n=1 Tax=Tribolium castaneum TaxID=7070 RepID=D6WYH9_TRICA|nr:hypothetical protein TcasGA2_TC006691 [Tribolium castaneum]